MVEFDQIEIVNLLGLDNDFDLLLEDFGNVYVPDSCTEVGKKCHVHFVFHSEEPEGLYMDTSKTQLNNFAALNDVIMVYPRTYGAWDAYGDFSAEYATVNGPYPKVIMAILDRLAGCSFEENE